MRAALGAGRAPARPPAAHREPAPRGDRRRAGWPWPMSAYARWWRSARPGLPRLGAIRVDTAVFAFALALTRVIGIASASSRRSRRRPGDLRHRSSNGTPDAGGRLPAHPRALVVAEVALALVLLVSAGLLLRSLVAAVRRRRRLRLAHAADDAGADHRSSLRRGRRDAIGSSSRRSRPSARAGRRGGGVHEPAAAERRFGHLRRASRTRAAASERRRRGAFRYAVTPWLLRDMRIPLRRGRLLDERDGAGAARASRLISESFAQAPRFPAVDPIGQRSSIGDAEGDCTPSSASWAT